MEGLQTPGMAWRCRAWFGYIPPVNLAKGPMLHWLIPGEIEWQLKVSREFEDAQDDAFRITGITDAQDSSKSWSYGYDLLDRLSGASRAGLSQGRSYDGNGNRLSQTGTAASSYSMSGTSNRLNGDSGALSRSYGYDAAGNASAEDYIRAIGAT